MFCNKCGTSLTSDLKCPNCGENYGRSHEKLIAVIITFVVYGLVYVVCSVRNFLSDGNYLIECIKWYSKWTLLGFFSYFAPALMILLLGVSCLYYCKRRSKLRNILWCFQLVLLIYCSLSFVYSWLLDIMYDDSAYGLSISYWIYIAAGLLSIAYCLICLFCCRKKSSSFARWQLFLLGVLL